MGFRPPRDGRHALGQVPTPTDVAQAMARWVLAAPQRPRTLLEPGAGACAFTRAALALVPHLAATVVERDRTALDAPGAPAAPEGAPESIIGDFLLTRALKGRRFDAILCNPPYIRHHYLTPAYKQRIARRLELDSGLRLSSLAGTHVHFLVRAALALAPGGRAAFLTGAEWLEARYGVPVREWLLSRGLLRAVFVAHPEERIFPRTLSTAAVLLLEATPSDGHVTHGVALPRSAWLTAIATAGDTNTNSNTRAPRPGRIHRVPAAALSAARWTRPLPAPRSARAPLPPLLGDRFRVRRGVATGANAFFVLSPDAARDLPADLLRPCLTSPRDLTPRFLFTCAVPRPALPAAALAFILRGEADGLHLRTVCRTRSPWYSVERFEPAPLLVGYLARGAPLVVDNRTRALHLNLFHGIWPRAGTPLRLVRTLAAYLRSPAGARALDAAARTYAGGLRKLEPSDLASLPLPHEFLIRAASRTSPPTRTLPRPVASSKSARRTR